MNAIIIIVIMHITIIIVIMNISIIVAIMIIVLTSLNSCNANFSNSNNIIFRYLKRSSNSVWGLQACLTHLA